ICAACVRRSRSLGNFCIAVQRLPNVLYMDISPSPRRTNNDQMESGFFPNGWLRSVGTHSTRAGRFRLQACHVLDSVALHRLWIGLFFADPVSGAHQTLKQTRVGFQRLWRDDGGVRSHAEPEFKRKTLV